MTTSDIITPHRMPPPSAGGRVIVAGSINMDVVTAAVRFPKSGETVAGTAILAAARMLRQHRHTQVICITLGARGVVALAGEQAIIMPGRTVTAVDTTGAGDCVAGAFAASLARGCDLATALNYATDAAAVSVQRASAGPSMPTPADIAALRARSDNAA